MKLELMDYFIERFWEIYGVTYFEARHLYNRWNIERLSSKEDIDAFLSSKTVHDAIFPDQTINIMKRYTSSEFEVMGIKFKSHNAEEHEFLDSKFGYRWKQVYHGMGEVWLDMYRVIDPKVDDNPIIEMMKI